MPKTLVFDNATLCADGSIGIRWLKQLTDPDTGELLFSEPHRTMIDIEGDVGEQIDIVRADPQLKGYAFDVPKMKALIRKFDAIGKADPDMKRNRAAKVKVRAEQRAADEARIKAEEAAKLSETPGAEVLASAMAQSADRA